MGVSLYIPLRLRRLLKGTEKQRLDYYDLYALEFRGVSVRLYVSHRRANKGTHIICRSSGDVVWEQLYPFGGRSIPIRERYYSLKPSRDTAAVTVVALRGKPADIVGLDDGAFRSHQASLGTNGVYLMTVKDVVDFLGKA